MYAGGIRELIQGWTKNQSAGAMGTPPDIFAMVFLWITACTSVPIQLLIAAGEGDQPWLAAYSSLYILWILELRRIAVRLGSFDTRAIIMYPVLMGFYLWIFALSAVKKIFHLKVTWKDRGIRLEE
jgi:4,4'-diaponeurosporenoate glycosyltransferase